MLKKNKVIKSLGQKHFKHSVCSLGFICHSLMSSAFKDEELYIFFILVTSYETDMLCIFLPRDLKPILLQSHPFQVLHCISVWNNIIPIPTKKINLNLTNPNECLKLRHASTFCNIILYVYCGVAHAEFRDLSVEGLRIYAKIVIDGFVVETL